MCPLKRRDESSCQVGGLQPKHEGSCDSVLPSTAAAIYGKAFAINPAAIGIVRFDNGLIVDVNETWQKIFGYSRDEAVGHSAIDLHLWPTEEDRTRYIEELWRQGPFRNREHRVLRKSGESFVASCSAELMVLQDETFIVSTWLDISDRKRSEEEMRRKEHLLSESQRAGHTGSWSREFGTDSIQWSDETYRIYGLNPASFSPRIRSLVNLILPEDRALIKEFIRSCENGEHPKDVELRIVRPDGTIRTIYGCGDLEYAPDGTPLRLIGTVQDITERKQAKEALRESNEKLALALQSSSMGVWQLDLREQKRHLDNQVCHCLGIDPARFTGTPEEIYAAVYPEDREGLKTAINKTITTGAAYEMEYRVVWPDGSLHFIASRGQLARDATGKPKQINGLIWDITERKKAEQVLKRSQRNLAEAQRQSHIGSFEFDCQAGCLEWSEEMFHICGVKHEDFQGKEQDFLSRIHPDDFEKVMKRRKEGLEVQGPLEFRFRIVCPNGETKFIRMVFETRFDDDGTPLRRMGTFQDITEMKLAEEEMAKLEGQLQQAQKMETVGRLAGGVAHDFNNMLSVILGHTELALEQVDSERPLHADLKEIQQAAQRSADLTRQLLAFARKQTIVPRILDLNETISGILKMLQRLIGENIELMWLPGAEVWPVEIDPSQIDQILTNLCINARDAIAEIGKITIKTEKIVRNQENSAHHPYFVSGESVLLTVSDNGCGMDQETLTHIFEPFFTTKRVGGGTGLGLATVYGIVRQNNGVISVDSKPGHGTTFEIYLPRYAGKTANVPKEIESGSDTNGQETILLVEDEQSILKLTTRILEKQGYLVLAASTPGEAMRLAREHAGEIHILMTDVVMPEMNGRELAKNLLSLYHHLKCLFMSGWTADILAHQGVLQPGTHFLQKPFSTKELSAVLQRMKQSA